MGVCGVERGGGGGHAPPGAEIGAPLGWAGMAAWGQ